MKRLVALFLLCLSGSAFSQKVAEPEMPDTWVVRTFQFPSTFFGYSRTNPAEINLNTPADVVIEAIKHTLTADTNAIPDMLLTYHGDPPFPAGSAALFDK